MEGLFSTALGKDISFGTIIVLLMALNFYLTRMLVSTTDSTSKYTTTLTQIKDVLKTLTKDVKKITRDLIVLTERRNT
jgi:hypothetical protein